MMTSLCPFSLPSFFSTVTPGQLPTYCVLPVRSLNSVVFPQFGLPASAILIAIPTSSLVYSGPPSVSSDPSGGRLFI